MYLSMKTHLEHSNAKKTRSLKIPFDLTCDDLIIV